MSKQLKFVLIAIGILAIGYYIARWTARYVLENYTEGPHIFFAQTFFAPDDLFLPVVRSNIEWTSERTSNEYTFDFSPKYLGPYRVGISGINGENKYIPDSIQASLECDVGGKKHSYKVDTVSMYWGTSSMDEGAVLGILHADDHSQVKCLVRLDNIEFDDVDRVSSYRIVVARMFVK